MLKMSRPGVTAIIPWELEMEEREITSATIGGREVPANRLICPVDNFFDLNMTINTDDPVEWEGICGNGHKWKFTVLDCPLAEQAPPSSNNLGDS